MDYDKDTHSMKCPKCGHGMDEVTHEGVTIDRCSNCQGLWFDEDEAFQLRSTAGGDVVDVGDPSEGEKWDSHADISCPICAKDMIKSSDPKQKHIWYEVCEEHGMFMDAGEFADFNSETLLDCFRGLIKGDRETTAP